MSTNIGNTTDPFYRYRRPKAIITTKFNKISITNLEEIATALHTKSSYILHYFKLKLSVPIGTKGEIQCNLNKDGIENVINQFIEEYILCEICKLPELFIQKDITSIAPEKSNKINQSNQSKVYFVCKACGHSVEIKENKMTKIFLKDN
jgi:translation initiation factor 2 beta subunit (eIF-2beta)/eIF-5